MTVVPGVERTAASMLGVVGFAASREVAFAGELDAPIPSDISMLLEVLI